jgi:N-acyl-D-amino-acid deacylase
MTLEEIGRERSVDPREAAYQLLLEEGEATGGLQIPILGASTAEADSIQAMLHPTASLCSDRAALAPYGALADQGDPNSYGPFPRVFRKYVRGVGLFTLEEAVRKMTSVPAGQFGLRDRGVLREGAWADVVVFDGERIADNATIEDYRRYPDGIPHVLVNGELVVENGEHTGAMPGTVLRGPACS